MAVYRIHIPLDKHEGQKSGQVRSVTRGTRVVAPEGEFSDLHPGRDYSRLDNTDSGKNPEFRFDERSLDSEAERAFPTDPPSSENTD